MVKSWYPGHLLWSSFENATYLGLLVYSHSSMQLPAMKSQRQAPSMMVGKQSTVAPGSISTLLPTFQVSLMPIR